MYDIIYEIIGHDWLSNYTSDQQYLYYITGAMVLILTVALIDTIRSIFRAFVRR